MKKIGLKSANIVENISESTVATSDSERKVVKMEENKTITKVKAKIDMLESGIEDFENNISNLQDELEQLQYDMEEVDEEDEDATVENYLRFFLAPVVEDF